MKIAVLPQDDKSRSKPFYSLLVGLGYTQDICAFSISRTLNGAGVYIPTFIP